MPRVIDISGPIEQGMWDYNVIDLGGAVLPPVAVDPVASIPGNGFDAHRLQFTTLTGTYVETAAHVITGTETLDRVSLDRLIRPAKIMRLSLAEPHTLIRADDLHRHDPGIRPGDALLIDTGWGRRWNQPGYVTKAPAFAASTLEWFLEQPFSILGLDTPVMECHWGDKMGVAHEAGKLLEPLYRRGMILIAPLVNLHQAADPTGTLIAFPLNVAGVCGAPCRAAFIEGARWEI